MQTCKIVGSLNCLSLDKGFLKELHSPKRGHGAFTGGPGEAFLVLTSLLGRK